MCGIIGYVGDKPALPIILDGLRRLEYRGYDSFGAAVIEPSGSMHIRKEAGRLTAEHFDVQSMGSLGIGHTRWATHGKPTTRNAHPHTDTDEQIAVALHKANVFLDLSGWLPRYIPDALIRETNTRLQEKVFFGSDYPYIQPDRWLRDFEELPLRDEVRPKLLLENARRVLKLG